MLPDAKSKEWSARGDLVTPGPQTNFRKTKRPISAFITSSKGCHYRDVDGNEWADWMLSFGPGLIGNGNKEVIDAIKKQLDNYIYLASGDFRSTIEVELAELFCKHTPCADEVRFGLAGTEAVQLAIRLARAYTKKRYFVRFEGHYHGWLDNILGGIVDDNPADKPYAIDYEKDLLYTNGRDPDAFKQGLKIQWNDADLLENVLKKWGDEIAVVMMEPILTNMGSCPPRPGYLEKVQELCKKYNVVLYFDEVITGFRVGLHSAQGLLGVTPDIATFGKAIGGGLPVSAVAGKREIMDQLKKRTVIGAGTFNGYAVGMAASLAALKYFEKDNGAIYKRVAKVQNKLMDGLRKIAKRYGHPMLVQGPTGVFHFAFVDKEIAYSQRDFVNADWVKMFNFTQKLDDQGIMIALGGRIFVGANHTETDVDHFLECADKAMAGL